MESAYDLYNISSNISNLSKEVEEELKLKFEEFNEICLYNQAKVMNAFRKEKISTLHLGKTTGYGYSDAGREAIEKIFADVFHTEDSLVRVQFVSGTHTISTALNALLMPNDTMLCITGTPYDTLCEVIGIKENSLSLKSYGVKYNQIDLLNKSDFDIEKIKEFIKANKVKLIHIQRSRGYELREALSISKIKEVIQEIKAIDNNIIVMVDNCYGEFTEKLEPTDVGADIACGSLIKNMGGGLCEMGGYIVGKKDLIELCAMKLTCPGVGKECGATLGQNRYILQGIFIAPTSVKNALMSASFAAHMLTKLGFTTYPDAFSDRSDIVQTVKFDTAEQLIKFIQGIQASSPIDSNVVPYPWDMPGYEDQVIMAAGTFIEGATIELSADGPIREPYVAYLQGGITYESAKLTLCKAIDNILKDER